MDATRKQKQSYCAHTTEDGTRCKKTIQHRSFKLCRRHYMIVVEKLLEHHNIVKHTQGMMHQPVITGFVRATIRGRRNRRRKKRRKKKRRRERLRVHPRLGRSHAAGTWWRGQQWWWQILLVALSQIYPPSFLFSKSTMYQYRVSFPGRLYQFTNWDFWLQPKHQARYKYECCKNGRTQ